MKYLEIFSRQHIEEVLCSNLIISDKSKITFSVDKSTDNEDFSLLNVKSDGNEHKYVLIKISKNLDSEKQTRLKTSKVLVPVFVIEDKNKVMYGAFEDQFGLQDFVIPEQNSLKCLKEILKTLAEHHALVLTEKREDEKLSEYSISKITEPIISIDFFKDLDKEGINKAVDTLNQTLQKILKSDLIVESIGCPLAKNVYVNQVINQSVFLSVQEAKLRVPPVYDALLYIFVLSNEEFRQRHFADLVLYYFNYLRETVQNLKSDVPKKLTRKYCEHQVQILLPVVKLRIANTLLTQQNPLKRQEILRNLLHFFKYPLINQEDVYEVTKNKLGSTNYELVDYSLVSLSETNGHLGEYYHLDIKVKFEEKEENLQLFCKFLIPPTDMFKDLMQAGPAKKEDFFYKKLMPLFAEHGLESLLDFAPKCYLSRENWLLVLEDLIRQGYISPKPNVHLPYEGLRATVENLAKFHSCTLILEEILSEKMSKKVRLDEDYGEYLEDTFSNFKDENALKEMYDNSFESIFYIIEKFPEVTEILNLSREELKERIRTAYFSISKIEKSDTIRNVITHGDMHVGNMLFCLNENKIIEKGILVDFQILRYISMGYELLFFIIENSTKETRDKYFEQLIDEYYQYISKNIRNFNLKPEVIFPRKSFDKYLNDMKLTALMGAFSYSFIIHIDSDFREEIFHNQEKYDYYFKEHTKELIDLSWSSDHYRNTLRGLVEDIVAVLKNEL